MKLLIFQFIVFLAMALIYNSSVQAAGYLSDPCTEKKHHLEKVREDFEHCIGSKDTTNKNASITERASNCSEELNRYAESVDELRTCIINSNLFKKKNKL